MPKYSFSSLLAPLDIVFCVLLTQTSLAVFVLFMTSSAAFCSFDPDKFGWFCVLLIQTTSAVFVILIQTSSAIPGSPADAQWMCPSHWMTTSAAGCNKR